MSCVASGSSQHGGSRLSNFLTWQLAVLQSTFPDSKAEDVSLKAQRRKLQSDSAPFRWSTSHWERKGKQTPAVDGRGGREFAAVFNLPHIHKVL